jgi:hypothetical protein
VSVAPPAQRENRRERRIAVARAKVVAGSLARALLSAAHVTKLLCGCRRVDVARRRPPPPERATQPSPGCLLLTRQGTYTMPQGNGGSSSATPPAYLMSRACVSRRMPVQGALR